jgi:hypothetical protein
MIGKVHPRTEDSGRNRSQMLEEVEGNPGTTMRRPSTSGRSFTHTCGDHSFVNNCWESGKMCRTTSIFTGYFIYRSGRIHFGRQDLRIYLCDFFMEAFILNSWFIASR